MSILIALTGASGAMGGEALSQLLDSPLDLKIRVFQWAKEKKKTAFYKKTLKRGAVKIELFKGDLSLAEDCQKFIEGASYVLHCAALIPPGATMTKKGLTKATFWPPRIWWTPSMPRPAKTRSSS
jgi:nucleoside-diphosphate-sugar epimerase